MNAVVVVDSGVANIGSVVAALERARAVVTVSRDWEVIRAAPRVLLPGVGAAIAAMRELDKLGLSERLPTLRQPVLGVCLGMQLLFEGSEEGGQATPAATDPSASLRGSPSDRGNPVSRRSADEKALDCRGRRGSLAMTEDRGTGAVAGQIVGIPNDAATHCPDPPAPTPCLSILPGIVRRLPEFPGVRIPHMGWNALIPRRAHPLVAGLTARDYAYFVHSFAVAESALTLMACEHGATFSAIVARGNFMGAQFHPERSAAVGARLLANFLTLTDEDLQS